MSNCKDCGGTPAPKVNKALFFDLDHTLVRPKVRTVKTASLPESIHPDFLAGVKEGMISKLPKNSEVVDFFTCNDLDKEGYMIPILSYRPTFPKDAEDWEFLPGVVDCVGAFTDGSYLFVIVTNQGGIEAGFHTAEEVEEKLSTILFAMSASLGSKMLEQASYFYCPSLKEHPDRKPNAGMFNRAADKLGIDLEASYYVGDLPSDEQAAKKAGIRHYYHIDTFLALGPFVTLGLQP